MEPKPAVADVTASWEASNPRRAVDQLQYAARSGRPVMIPGALEPNRESHPTMIEPRGPRGPQLTPVHPEDGAQAERDHDAGGRPAAPVTVLDRLQLMLLHTTERLIRVLHTRPRFGGA